MPRGEYDPETAEPKWQRRWVENETYAYDDVENPDTAFSIDTPPPTVSGDLHMGHLYQFTLQDFVARFHRMYDDDVFFPFGYDDNGIASERLAERELDIRHGDFDRDVFQEKCRGVCDDYEESFTDDVQSLAISVDWDHTYQTIEPRVQRISQLSFLDLYEQGREYRERAPAIWCPDCETAISQVETEDAEQAAHFNDIAFQVADAATDESVPDEFVISTTRPELLPACVAVFVHPDDDENAPLVGQQARVPLFDHEVPILADERVDRETGSGIVMSCTFGDQTDIEWYQAHNLNLRVAIDEAGQMTEQAGPYEGLSAEEAGQAIVDDLEAAGPLRDRRDISHSVNVHERCGTGIEFLVTEQWYVEMLDKREEYLEAGRQMDWYPEKMFTRYEHWIDGLQWDWCISRQRSSGIPFPVWYCEECDAELFAARDQLPVDPLSASPPVDACPECGHEEFVAEDDVFDTWATSSLTPLINAGWDWDPEADADPSTAGPTATDGGTATSSGPDSDSGSGDRPAGPTRGAFTMDYPELYPASMRPQGHDIISFWLFHTIVKCYEHTGEVPFDSVMINGMVLDESREAMSKSKGNIVAPEEVLQEYPVDAARFWAAGSAVGDDLPYQEKGLRAGEKLLRKLWNASKLVENLSEAGDGEHGGGEPPAALADLDRWLLAELDAEVERQTSLLQERSFSKARDSLRSFFWGTFCDDYLEIAKQRDDASAAYTLRTAHERFVRLFAPLLAHISEELWTEMYADDDTDTDTDTESVHRQDWPVPLGIEANREAGSTAMSVVGALRKFKSDNQLPLNAALTQVAVYDDVGGFEDDITSAMHVGQLDVLPETEPPVESVITGINLDYATIGPKYGGQVSDIDTAIETGSYDLDGDQLHAGPATLEAEEFSIQRERQYTGDGTLVDADDAIVIVEE